MPYAKHIECSNRTAFWLICVQPRCIAAWELCATEIIDNSAACVKSLTMTGLPIGR